MLLFAFLVAISYSDRTWPLVSSFISSNNIPKDYKRITVLLYVFNLGPEPFIMAVW